MNAGIGTSTDPSAAVSAYKSAIKAGEITGYAALARLVGRSTQAP